MSMTISDIKIRIDISQSIHELKSLIKKAFYCLVSFAIVQTATNYLLHPCGDNQRVFLDPQFSRSSSPLALVLEV